MARTSYCFGSDVPTPRRGSALQLGPLPTHCATPYVPQEVFLTTHHLGIALEYADGGDLSEYIDNHAQQGVSTSGITPSAAPVSAKLERPRSA